MRELQLHASQEGLPAIFHEIESLASQRRFSDCQHKSEPGWVITKAVASGEFDAGASKLSETTL